MSVTGDGFSADSVRSYINDKRRKQREEQQAAEAAHRAELEKLRAAFMEREVHPEALERVATAVRRAVDRGEKRALVLQFPSAWLPDKGRAITNQDPDWGDKLDGFALRARDFFERELAPRGFQIKAEILDWPGGMPGDVGIFLTWKQPDEM
jgi:hypothetical protein